MQAYNTKQYKGSRDVGLCKIKSTDLKQLVAIKFCNVQL